MTEKKLTGRCLCGHSTFELMGSHNWIAHCHCHSCRKATASPFTTWIGQENGKWKLTGTSLTTYESSPGVVRGFCGTCGSPMFYRTQKYPEETHFYAALFDKPESVEPEAQYHSNEMISWSQRFADCHKSGDAG